MIEGLNSLLSNPESLDHFHVFSEDSSHEISFSILTPEKIKNLNCFTEIEQDIILEIK